MKSPNDNVAYKALILKKTLNEQSMTSIKGGIAWGGPTMLTPRLIGNPAKGIRFTGDPAPTNPPSPD